MSITKEKARSLLKANGLRVTAPRIAVLRLLAAAQKPMSHSDMLVRLGDTDWDPATIYRNLIKLRDAGLAPIVSRVGGIDRYAIARSDGQNHQHPHFVCDDCGLIACLPDELVASIKAEGAWGPSIRKATIQMRGACPDCIKPSS